MIDYHRFCQIKHLHDHQGLHVSQIATQLTLDPRTVSSWLGQATFRPRKSAKRPRKLDPFKADVVRMLDRYPSSAVQVCQTLKENGFTGGYSIVKDSVRTVRPRHKPAFLTLACAPGECAQVDWGAFGSMAVGQTTRRLRCFVMVLCDSRLMDVESTVSQTMEHVLACHQHAFDFFGGIPKTVMVDNLTSAVLKRAIGEDPVFNPQCADFATHDGFTIRPCHVGKGNEKGRVEHAVGSVKKHVLAGLDLPDFTALNPAVRHWLDTGANVRLHGQTRAKPTELWHRETSSLGPLPLYPYAIATVSQVRASRQFRLPLDPNRSSVPAHLAGHALTLKSYPDRLCIYQGETLVARHTRRYDRHLDLEDPDHPKPLLAHRKKARDHTLFMRFLALVPSAEPSDLTLEERRFNAARHVRHIVALRDISGQDAVARALDDALAYEAFSSDSIANLLEQRARFTPEASPLRLSRRQDLLDIRIEQPDLSMYHHRPHEHPDTEESQP